MKNEQKARRFLQSFYENRPRRVTRLDDAGKGLYIILRMLGDAKDEVLAGDIASTLKMSTPRVAAALNALEKKGHITRTSATTDKRKTVVAITNDGRAALAACENKILELIDYLFENIGERDMDEFLRISSEINAAIDNKTMQN